MSSLQSTPREDGFRMPGEFEPHAGCWMLWPERPDVWRNGGKPAQRAFVNVATAISQFEPVTMLVSASQYLNARAMLPAAIRVVEMSNNDSWLRDTGPSFLINHQGELRGVDWKFNAYGGVKEGLYFPWDADDRLAQKICELVHAPRYRADIVCEGGAIHVDGQGTLITTRDCLLNKNRNPDKSEAQVEASLRAYLGVDKVIWLDNPLESDETDGHVDGLCCFVRPGVVLLGWSDDTHSPYFTICRDAEEKLRSTTDAQGRTLEIIKLPYPDEPLLLTSEEAAGIDVTDAAMARQEPFYLADSYINFYIANGGIVMPTFGQPSDQVAQQILADAFPDRKIVPVAAREIGIGGGLIHCITQQQPLV